MKYVINTDKAPAAIGSYSQAVKINDLVFLSGQIALLPETMELISENIDQQIEQVFKNMSAVAEEAGGSLAHIVKLTIYLIDLQCFTKLNTIMANFFDAPYPARAAVEVKALPKGALVEMDAIMACPD